MIGSLLAEIRCACNECRVPLCALCDDDIFCPQCGDKIVELKSRQQRPEGGAVWVYATDGQFDLPVTLTYGNRYRQLRWRQPVLTIGDCNLSRTKGLFASEVEVHPSRTEHEVVVRLKASLTAGQPPQFSALPAQGLPAVLHLEGEFGSQDLELTICRAPRLSIQIQGDGLHPVMSDRDPEEPSAGLLVDVTREGARVPVTVSLEATDAPIYLDEDICEYNFHGEDRKFPNPIRKGTILKIGEPVEVGFDADLQNLQEAGGKTLSFWVNHASYPELIDVTFQRAELGEIQFSMNAFRRDQMMFGETFPGSDEPPFWVRNTGGADLLLGPPEVRDASGPENCRWISAWWPGIGRNETLPLKKGLRHDLAIKIDLTGLNREILVENSLRATVAVVDDKQRVWRLAVVINQLVEPPVYSSALCIDFGNTNSCAATRNPGLAGFPPPDKDVATLTTPAETFPTAMLFTNVESDPPSLLIGRQAVEQSRLYSAATLVTGLKRNIGDGASTTVWDTQGNHRPFKYAELVELYLAELIRQCESRLRHQVSEVALSYPVKFRTGQNRARFDHFERIVRSTAARFARPGVVLTGQAFEVKEFLDEASCVCYGFVLDRNNASSVLERLRARVGDSSAGARTLNIAAFDFGGGSIDTAILRYTFDVVGQRIRQIESALVDSGGDASFGGDNVTVAVFECLLARLEQLLRAADNLGFSRVRWADPNSSGYHGSDPLERANYQKLWEAAELLKHYSCDLAGTAQDLPPGDDDSRRETARRSLLEQLRVILGDIVIEVRDESGHSARSVREADGSQQLSTWLEDGRLLVPLDEVYAHRVSKDLRGLGGYTIAERIQACVEELRDQAIRGHAALDHLILAGASCRVPLVLDLVKSILVGAFPDARWEFDVHSAKSKVATGLSRYCERRQGLRVVPPDMQLPFDLGLWFPAFDEFACLIPQFTALDDSSWFALAGGDFKAAISAVGRRLAIYRRFSTERGLSREEHGWFDFTTAGCGPGDAAALPQEIPLDTTARIRLLGDPWRLEMEVAVPGAQPVCWSMVAADPQEETRA